MDVPSLSRKAFLLGRVSRGSADTPVLMWIGTYSILQLGRALMVHRSHVLLCRGESCIPGRGVSHPVDSRTLQVCGLYCDLSTGRCTLASSGFLKACCPDWASSLPASPPSPLACSHHILAILPLKSP